MHYMKQCEKINTNTNMKFLGIYESSEKWSQYRSSCVLFHLKLVYFVGNSWIHRPLRQTAPRATLAKTDRYRTYHFNDWTDCYYSCYPGGCIFDCPTTTLVIIMTD